MINVIKSEDYQRKFIVPSIQNIVIKYSNNIEGEEARVIEHRVLNCYDLPSAEARYHKLCRDQFNLQSIGKTSTDRKGRPCKDADGFEALCEWIETQGELYTLEELQEHLKIMTILSNLNENHNKTGIATKK